MQNNKELVGDKVEAATVLVWTHTICKLLPMQEEKTQTLHMVHGAFFAAIANLFTMTFEIKMAAGMNFALIRALNPADG